MTGAEVIRYSGSRAARSAFTGAAAAQHAPSSGRDTWDTLVAALPTIPTATKTRATHRASCPEAILDQQRAYDSFKAIGYAEDPFVPDECISCP